MNCEHKVFVCDKRVVMRECKRLATSLLCHDTGETKLCWQHFKYQINKLKEVADSYEKLAQLASECPIHVPGMKISIPSVSFLLGESRRIKRQIERLEDING